MDRAFNRLRGVVEMLAFRPNWRRNFDIGPSAVNRSFLAAIPAAPLFVLSIAGPNEAYRSLAETPASAHPTGIVQGAVLYFCLWTYFPLVARIFVRIFRIEKSFAPWLVVHNWTVLLLVGLQAALGALVLTGLLSPAAYLNLGSLYFIFALYAHCRVAAATLDAPVPVAVGGASLAILIWLLVQLFLIWVFSGLVLQA